MTPAQKFVMAWIADELEYLAQHTTNVDSLLAPEDHKQATDLATDLARSINLNPTASYLLLTTPEKAWVVPRVSANDSWAGILGRGVRRQAHGDTGLRGLTANEMRIAAAQFLALADEEEKKL